MSSGQISGILTSIVKNTHLIPGGKADFNAKSNERKSVYHTTEGNGVKATRKTTKPTTKQKYHEKIFRRGKLGKFTVANLTTRRLTSLKFIVLTVQCVDDSSVYVLSPHIVGSDNFRKTFQ